MSEFEAMVKRIHEVSELLNEPEIECYSDTLEITGSYYNGYEITVNSYKNHYTVFAYSGCEITVSFCKDHYAIFAVSYDDIHIHEAASLELTASIEDIEKKMLKLSQKVKERYKAKHG